MIVTYNANTSIRLGQAYQNELILIKNQAKQSSKIDQ